MLTLCTDSSKQQEVPQVYLRKQGVSVSGTSLRSEHSPSDFYSLWPMVTGYIHRLGISVNPYLAGSPSRPSSLFTTSGPALRDARPGWFHCKQKEIRAGIGARYPVSHGLTQLGLRSYPSGSFVPETVTTLFSFLRPGRPVYATASFRPVGSCQSTAAMAGPDFSYFRNPDPSISGGVYHFYGRLHSGMGRPHGDSQISGTWTPQDRELPCLELKAVGAALHTGL